MKRLLAVLTVLAFLAFPARAASGEAPDEATSELRVMLQAAVDGDAETGRAAAARWNEALDARDSLDARIDFDELLWLAKLIAWEADSERIGMEWRMCIGEVVLNRVASPEFPDSVEEVVCQEGAYPGTEDEAFRERFTPDEDSVNAALALLRGERHLSPWVVWQSARSLGARDYARYYDEEWGVMYFCASAHPEFYR